MQTKKPNLLFISTDQLRFDCLGYKNRYPVKTPNLDRLAARGMDFDHSYCPIPICCPARQSLVCGKRAESFGALWNYDQGTPVGSLPKEAFSWARALSAAGYQNGYVGKWHVSPTLTPLDFGYDDYVSEYEIMDSIGKKYPGLTYPNGFFGDVNPVPLDDSSTHQNAAHVIRLLEKYQSPWHVKMDFGEPHLPCRPSQPFASMYENVPKWAAFDDPLENKPYIQRQQLLNWNTHNLKWEDFSTMAALYYGYISQVDDAIGRVLSYLEQSGKLSDTIIIFTSDHGDMAGERHMMDKHYVLYDEVVRTPLLICLPGGPKGETCGEFVINALDLVPTILELCGLPVPNGLDGKSLVPLLTGAQTGAFRPYALSTYNGQQFGLYTQRMLRSHKWKYIWNLTDTDELYDMQNDPHELVNLAQDPSKKGLLAELRRDLLAELDAAGDCTVKSGWLREQLMYSRKL